MAVQPAVQSSSVQIQPTQLKPSTAGKAVDKPAEQVKQAAPPPPPPPPQAAVAPTVNTSGQRIGTTISTSA
ncbi:hypothetical protein [Duganella qianjiadongensis]|uniref:Uncharacterized protein n=1 Tax=Duganella qianjiadongensis TaxID=2692176 RepID=A0ABW9VLN7_9BURK|nr:hypothetical protein [Duganella qianjiadongensis]MYM39991.1 hypothetical protein [Duganella qianjiadongensis]